MISYVCDLAVSSFFLWHGSFDYFYQKNFMCEHKASPESKAMRKGDIKISITENKITMSVFTPFALTSQQKAAPIAHTFTRNGETNGEKRRGTSSKWTKAKKRRVKCESIPKRQWITKKSERRIGKRTRRRRRKRKSTREEEEKWRCENLLITLYLYTENPIVAFQLCTRTTSK